MCKLSSIFHFRFPLLKGEIVHNPIPSLYSTVRVFVFVLTPI